MGGSTVTIEELNRTAARIVPHRLAEHVRKIPHKQFLTCLGRKYTYLEFDQETNRLAHSFQALGVSKGDTVCQMLPNRPEFLLNWIALAKLGAIDVGINTEFKDVSLSRIINLTEAKILILDVEYIPEIERISDSLSHLSTIILLGEDGASAGGLSRFRKISYSELNSTDSSELTIQLDRTDPFALICTSGTTGASKAVEISNTYALHFAGELLEHLGIRDDDVLYSPYPLFHTEASILTFIAALHRGASVVIGRKFSASRFWDEIREHGITYTCLMGAVMTILHRRPPLANDADNPLRLVLAAPTPLFWEDFEARFGVTVMETYGSTESCQPVWDVVGKPHRAGACGVVCQHYDVRIVDDYDNPMETGEIGEIVIRPKEPYTQMTGYYRNPEATVATWRNLWHHTGDIGFFDESGYLHFEGRKKDAIRRRGKNISAFEVEEALNEHPSVLESAVIGVPSDMTEEEVKAVITLRPNQDASPEEIIRWVANKLPKYSVPRFLEIVDELPKSPTSKVQKVELRSNWRTKNTFDAELGSYCTI